MLTEILKTSKPFIDGAETEEYLRIVSTKFLGRGERHHILPESIYPDYARCKWNLVNLSYADHYRVHELLPFMLHGKARASMLYAWNLMCGRTNGVFVDSAKYSELRLQHAMQVSLQVRLNQPMHRPEVIAKCIGRKNPELSARLLLYNPSKTKEFKDFMSLNNPMYLEENKDKFRGDKNWNYGKHLSDERKEILREARLGVPMNEHTKLKISATLRENTKSLTRVKIGNVIYPSISDAATKLNVNRHTIARWVKQGKAEKLDTQTVKVEIEGVEYSSMSDAARGLAVSVATIRSYLKHGKATLLDNPQKPK